MAITGTTMPEKNVCYSGSTDADKTAKDTQIPAFTIGK